MRKQVVFKKLSVCAENGMSWIYRSADGFDCEPQEDGKTKVRVYAKDCENKYYKDELTISGDFEILIEKPVDYKPAIGVMNNEDRSN